MKRKQLNEDFYQNVLRQYEQNDSITVTSFMKTTACEKGTSHMYAL